MNKFSIVGKCLNITKLDSNKYIINIISNSPMHKNITIPIRISKSNYINKIKENDLLGINGVIDIQDSDIVFVASKVIWLPEQ
ncbi:MAG: hypothetical protein ACOX1F_07590 [Erysipelotrichaceae bacterium]